MWNGLLRGAIVAALTALAVAGLRAVGRTLTTWRVPAHDPATFARRGRAPGTRAVLVCAGDSFTHGVISADYVGPLREHLGADGYEVVNAGLNGNLAWNVLQRLDDVIACRPDAVTLLVGTNDVLGTLDSSWEQMYRSQQHIPASPTLDWYRENVGLILGRLRAETDTRVAVLDLPPIGEDLDSDINGRVARYNAALREVAAAAGVPVMPLHDRLVSMLPPGHRPMPFTGSRDLLATAMVRHYALRRTWDEVAADHGLAVLTDQVHLGERAATVVTELIADWLASPVRG